MVLRYLFPALFLMLTTAITIPTNAQNLEWGAKAGMTHQNFGDAFGNWDNFSSRFSSDFGGDIGVYGRAMFAGFYVQPEVMFHNTNKNIDIDDRNYEISYSRLNVPILIGQRFFKTVRYSIGPVGTLNLGGSSDASDIDNISFSSFNIGMQAGLGLDIWKLRIDAKYQIAFSEVTDEVSIRGESFTPSSYGNFFLLEVGYKLGG
jgi:hypothetical protein